MENIAERGDASVCTGASMEIRIGQPQDLRTYQRRMALLRGIFFVIFLVAAVVLAAIALYYLVSKSVLKPYNVSKCLFDKRRTIKWTIKCHYVECIRHFF